jgi:hypothetical protein
LNGTGSDKSDAYMGQTLFLTCGDEVGSLGRNESTIFCGEKAEVGEETEETINSKCPSTCSRSVASPEIFEKQIIWLVKLGEEYQISKDALW